MPSSKLLAPVVEIVSLQFGKYVNCDKFWSNWSAVLECLRLHYAANDASGQDKYMGTIFNQFYNSIKILIFDRSGHVTGCHVIQCHSMSATLNVAGKNFQPSLREWATAAGFSVLVWR